VSSESVIALLTEIGAAPVEVADATPQALRRHLAAELARWKTVLEEAGVQPQ
jgi:tripartite-type tricarboxylate transporter receptor subunit TctC